MAFHMDFEGFDPSLWFVAEDGDQVVASLGGRILDDVGWISTLGVSPAWRGRGLGQVLLHRSFDAFRDRGVKKASLLVDSENETGATALYEKVGMRATRQYDYYERRLRTPPRA